jgi:ATP-dependent DNA helicase RecG
MQHPIVRNDPKRFSNERESLYFDRKSARLNAK